MLDLGTSQLPCMGEAADKTESFNQGNFLKESAVAHTGWTAFAAAGVVWPLNNMHLESCHNFEMLLRHLERGRLRSTHCMGRRSLVAPDIASLETLAFQQDNPLRSSVDRRSPD